MSLSAARCVQDWHMSGSRSDGSGMASTPMRALMTRHALVLTVDCTGTTGGVTDQTNRWTAPSGRSQVADYLSACCDKTCDESYPKDSFGKRKCSRSGKSWPPVVPASS